MLWKRVAICQVERSKTNPHFGAECREITSNVHLPPDIFGFHVVAAPLESIAATFMRVRPPTEVKPPPTYTDVHRRT